MRSNFVNFPTKWKSHLRSAPPILLKNEFSSKRPLLILLLPFQTELLANLDELRQDFPEEYEWSRLSTIHQGSTVLEPAARVRLFFALRNSNHIDDGEWIAMVTELTSTDSAASWLNEVMDVLPPECASKLVKFDAALMCEQFQKGAKPLLLIFFFLLPCAMVFPSLFRL